MFPTQKAIQKYYDEHKEEVDAFYSSHKEQIDAAYSIRSCTDPSELQGAKNSVTMQLDLFASPETPKESPEEKRNCGKGVLQGTVLGEALKRRYGEDFPMDVDPVSFVWRGYPCLDMGSVMDWAELHGMGENESLREYLQRIDPEQWVRTAMLLGMDADAIRGGIKVD